MKSIHYDAEGDILSVTFAETQGTRLIGVELSDNIVLYYDPELEQPLKLIVLSYQALVRASLNAPLPLDGLVRTPGHVQATVTALLQRPPLTAFFQFVEAVGPMPPTSHLYEIFTAKALQTVATS